MSEDTGSEPHCAGANSGDYGGGLGVGERVEGREAHIHQGPPNNHQCA